MEFEDRLDPDVAEAFVTKLGLDLTDVEGARATLLAGAAERRPPSNPNVEASDHYAPGLPGEPEVRVRLYQARGRTGVQPCLLWIHGGGHVLGEVEQDDPTAEHFVDEVGCTVVSVDWRRSPEHPFPAAMNDCYAALAWVHRNAGELNIDPKRVAIGGASSGGGSAAGLALMARDLGEFPICHQSLNYPMLDDRNVTPSSYAIVHPRVWNRETNALAWQFYRGDESDSVSIYAAPSRASDLTGLPPAFVGVGDMDLFLDEDIEYAQRLLQAGVPTELHVYAGGNHAFNGLAPESSLAIRYNRDRDDMLRKAFNR